MDPPMPSRGDCPYGRRRRRGASCKGVEADSRLVLPPRMARRRGAAPRGGDSIRTKDILLIARALADRLQLGVGDKVEMLFVEEDERPLARPFQDHRALRLRDGGRWTGRWS